VCVCVCVGVGVALRPDMHNFRSIQYQQFPSLVIRFLASHISPPCCYGSHRSVPYRTVLRIWARPISPFHFDAEAAREDVFLGLEVVSEEALRLD